MTEVRSPRRGMLARFLDVVERVGNRLPDPLTLFVIFAALVVAGSAVMSGLGVSVTHPADGKIITAHNLLTADGLRQMLTEMVKNFASFPPLGLVLVTMIGIGVAERSGLITAALKRLVMLVPKSALTATLVFAGVMSSMAADAGYVVLTPLGAVLFAGFGRHPLAGLAAAFAGVSGGFSANLLLTSLDPLLAGLSTSAAQIVDKNYVVQPTANYYFMIFSVFLITAVGTFVTSRIVEPRLGTWTPGAGYKADHSIGNVTVAEKKGLTAAMLMFVVFGLLVLALALPADGVLRGDNQSLDPFYKSLVPLLMLGFLLCGIAYGTVAGTIRSDKNVAAMTTETMGTMGAYIVLAFVAAQFVAYFSWSNLGLITAVTGAQTLKSVGLTGIPLIIAFIVVSAFINIFIGSASAKWAVMGPVFVPMLMVMGYSPELVQAGYRVGDSITNTITPLLPYFPIIIAFARKYDEKAGLGTLIATMLPYSLGFALAWSLALIVWIMAGIPLGPGAPLHYTPGG
jgi:aminobenzoyl-glutamate transport protein